MDKKEVSLSTSGLNENKVSESMNIIKHIQEDCEDLIRKESELEKELEKKTSLIESQKNNSFIQITYEQALKYNNELKEKEIINNSQFQNSINLRTEILY